MAAVALVTVLAQPLMVLVLLALAALHFGCGEVAVAAWRSGVRPSALRAALTTAAVGLAVIAGPLALHPEVTDPLLAALHPTLPGMVAPWMRLGLLGVGLVGGSAAAALAWPAAGMRGGTRCACSTRTRATPTRSPSATCGPPCAGSWVRPHLRRPSRPRRSAHWWSSRDPAPPRRRSPCCSR